MWYLTVRSPSVEPREHVLTVGKTTLGRKMTSDIVLADELVSRAHAEIEYDADQGTIVIKDLSSRNGTYVNHERLFEPRKLSDFDQIRIGHHVIRVSNREMDTWATSHSLPETQPLTDELLLEVIDQYAVLLHSIGHRLNNVLELGAALQEVSKMMQVAVGAEKCEFVLADHFDQLAQLGFPTSIARRAIEQRSIIAIPDISTHSGFVPGPSTLLLRVRSVLCIPVMTGQDVAALTYLYTTDPSARPFDQHDVHLAVAISHQAALAIERTRLIQKSRWLEQLASLDGLTGLHNRRHFFQQAEREFERAQRFRKPLCAIMLDIDHFKRVNDTFGHAVGDQVLQAVAARCRGNVRALDLLARYGGEEFVALLLETSLARAAVVAERLRRAVADTPVDTDQGPVNVTISLGLAPVGEECPSLLALLDDADVALYKAKKAGRNRVEVVT